MATAPKPATDAGAEPTSELAAFVVAHGRTISHGDDPKKPVRHYGPGETIELPEEEGERLRELGFLVLEDGTQALRTEGPAVIKGAEIEEK